MINVCTINSLLLFCCNATCRQSCSSSIYSKSKRLENKIIKAPYPRKNRETAKQDSSPGVHAGRGLVGQTLQPLLKQEPLWKTFLSGTHLVTSYGLVTSDELRDKSGTRTVSLNKPRFSGKMLSSAPRQGEIQPNNVQE